MVYNGKAHIENGQVLCASQLCDNCDFAEFFNCVDVEIIDTETKGQDILKLIKEIKNREV